LSGEPIAETTTSASGAFSFGGLRPGLYTVVLHPLPTMDILEGDTIAVTVGADVELPMPLVWTGNLIQTIAQVRAEPDSVLVAFEGVVTAPVGVFSASTSGNQFNVQDATGGILVLNTPLAGGPQLGDSVRVVGMKDVSAGEVVIRAPTVTLLGSGRPVPAPVSRTAAQVVASDSTDPYQGRLVSVGDVVVDSVQGGTSVGYNVYVRDVTGASRFIVRVGVDSVVLRRTDWLVGGHYDITGTLAAFNAPQVKIRFPTDVVPRTSATPIGDVRAAAFADSAGTRGDTVTIEGVVHTAQGTFGSTSAYIQDPTGGVLLFNLPTDAGLAVGDSVRITGAIAWFSGELEVAGLAGGVPVIVEDLGAGTLPVPRTISGDQFLSRAYEGELVRLGNVVVDSIGTVSGSGGYTVWVITTDADTVQVRVNSTAIGIPTSTWTVGGMYDVVGALSRFGGSTTQLKPRSLADVTAASAISIAAAEALPAGDTVTVEGVVTVGVGPFGTLNAYIQDASGGIQIFGVDTANVRLEIGEAVRVTGVMSAFSGEIQIARFNSSSPLIIVELGPSVAPTPLPVTGAEILARTYEGELISLDNVTVTAVGAVSGSGGYNVTVQTQDGSTVTVRHDRALVGVPVGIWVVGNVYDVVGIPSAFNSAPQVKLRGFFDVAPQ
jgi:hypothetical protein